MKIRQNIILTILFLSIASLSIWLQFGLLVKPTESKVFEAERNNPDYYIENFISTGMDKLGKKYEIISERMAYYSIRDRILLDHPHIVQYDLDGTPSHIYAESGLLYNDRSTVLLTGKVRVIETEGGGAIETDKMTIRLK